MSSPYRGREPVADDEPPPDFKVSGATAGEEWLGCVLFATVPASFTFVDLPIVSCATMTAGLVAGAVAYFTHDRRRRRRDARKSERRDRSDVAPI